MNEWPESVVVLTGAGVSADSGISTFRDSGGLWEEHSIEDVATPEGFRDNPEHVHGFYNQRRRQLLSDRIRPNPAHIALADFEQQFPGEFLLVTQNVDNLHERAGSRNVLHMHGELLRMRCSNSGEVHEVREDIDTGTPCPCCGVPGSLRPHVVWFGEMPLHMSRIMEALERCQLFIAIGTSGNVYPAAGFHQTARARKAHTVELNLERSDSVFDEHIEGRASEIVPEYLDRLLARERRSPAHS